MGTESIFRAVAIRLLKGCPFKIWISLSLLEVIFGLDGGDSNIEVDIAQSQFESSSVSLSDLSNGNGRTGERLRA